MNPLETTWRGWRFRSRTEARWAVLMTAAGIRFDYEPEGFDLPSGWYLPDFWLPDMGAWLEVKGTHPNDGEIAKAFDLFKASGKPVMFAIGVPDPDGSDEVLMIRPDGREWAIRLNAPRSAYIAARAERFDGKPVKRTVEPKRRCW